LKHLRLIPVFVILLGLLLAWWLVQFWRGPQLEAYQLQSRPLVQTVVATGRVAAISRAQVGSPMTAVVMERRVQEGDTVQPGDILAVLRADDLQAQVREAEAALARIEQSARPEAESILRLAEARLAQATRESERRSDLFQRQLIARESMEQAIQAEAEARSAVEQARLTLDSLAAGHPDESVARERLATARAQLAKATIRAEVAGTVLTRNAEPGDLVQPGRVLFEIAHEGGSEIRVPLDEKNLEVLRLGQSAQCIADAYPSRPFGARVGFIAPSVDPTRGTVEIRLIIEPVPDFLRQDMTVSVNVETGYRESAMVVPNDALAAVHGSTAKLWRVVDGRVSRQLVELGLRGMTMTEIMSGIQPGDWVLANARADVQQDDRIRIKAAALPDPDIDSNSRRELLINFN